MRPEPAEQPSPIVLHAARSRRPRRYRVVIALVALLAAALMASGLLVSDSHPLVGMLLTIVAGLNVASVAYGLWAAGKGRVTVEEHDVVLRPGRVLNHRFRIQDVVRVAPGTTRWRGTTLSLRDGREVPMPSLSGQDVQRLGELLQEAADRRSAPGMPNRSGAEPHRTNVVGAAPHRARTRGASGVSAEAGRAGAVRAPGAARWPDPPDPPHPPGRG